MAQINGALLFGNALNNNNASSNLNASLGDDDALNFDFYDNPKDLGEKRQNTSGKGRLSSSEFMRANPMNDDVLEKIYNDAAIAALYESILERLRIQELLNNHKSQYDSQWASTEDGATDLIAYLSVNTTEKSDPDMIFSSPRRIKAGDPSLHQTFMFGGVEVNTVVNDGELYCYGYVVSGRWKDNKVLTMDLANDPMIGRLLKDNSRRFCDHAVPPCEDEMILIPLGVTYEQYAADQADKSRSHADRSLTKRAMTLMRENGSNDPKMPTDLAGARQTICDIFMMQIVDRANAPRKARAEVLTHLKHLASAEGAGVPRRSAPSAPAKIAKVEPSTPEELPDL